MKDIFTGLKIYTKHCTSKLAAFVTIIFFVFIPVFGIKKANTAYDVLMAAVCLFLVLTLATVTVSECSFGARKFFRTSPVSESILVYAPLVFHSITVLMVAVVFSAFEIFFKHVSLIEYIELISNFLTMSYLLLTFRIDGISSKPALFAFLFGGITFIDDICETFLSIKNPAISVGVAIAVVFLTNYILYKYLRKVYNDRLYNTVPYAGIRKEKRRPEKREPRHSKFSDTIILFSSGKMPVRLTVIFSILSLFGLFAGSLLNSKLLIVLTLALTVINSLTSSILICNIPVYNVNTHENPEIKFVRTVPYAKQKSVVFYLYIMIFNIVIIFAAPVLLYLFQMIFNFSPYPGIYGTYIVVYTAVSLCPLLLRANKNLNVCICANLLFAAAALIMYIVFRDIFNLIPIYTAAAIIINVLSAADFTLRYRKA